MEEAFNDVVKYPNEWMIFYDIDSHRILKGVKSNSGHTQITDMSSKEAFLEFAQQIIYDDKINNDYFY